MLGDLLRGSEQLAAVSSQAVDWTVVSLDLTEGCKRVNVPKAQQPSSASTEQNRGAWHHTQSTNPVCLGIDQLVDAITANS